MIQLSCQRIQTKPHPRNARMLYGDVPVSTGVWRRDKRAAAPDRHKTGNYKLNNNNTVAVAA